MLGNTKKENLQLFRAIARQNKALGVEWRSRSETKIYRCTLKKTTRALKTFNFSIDFSIKLVALYKNFFIVLLVTNEMRLRRLKGKRKHTCHTKFELRTGLARFLLLPRPTFWRVRQNS